MKSQSPPTTTTEEDREARYNKLLERTLKQLYTTNPWPFKPDKLKPWSQVCALELPLRQGTTDQTSRAAVRFTKGTSPKPMWVFSEMDCVRALVHAGVNKISPISIGSVAKVLESMPKKNAETIHDSDSLREALNRMANHKDCQDAVLWIKGTKFVVTVYTILAVLQGNSDSLPKRFNQLDPFATSTEQPRISVCITVSTAIANLMDGVRGSRNCGLFSGRAVGAARTMFSARRTITGHGVESLKRKATRVADTVLDEDLWIHSPLNFWVLSLNRLPQASAGAVVVLSPKDGRTICFQASDAIQIIQAASAQIENRGKKRKEMSTESVPEFEPHGHFNPFGRRKVLAARRAQQPVPSRPAAAKSPLVLLSKPSLPDAMRSQRHPPTTKPLPESEPSRKKPRPSPTTRNDSGSRPAAPSLYTPRD